MTGSKTTSGGRMILGPQYILIILLETRIGRQFVKNVVTVDSKPKGRVFIDRPNFKETQRKWHDVQDAKRASIGSHAPSSSGGVVMSGNNMSTSSILFIEETELKQLCNHPSKDL
jgi:hypothetical protein